MARMARPTSLNPRSRAVQPLFTETEYLLLEEAALSRGTTPAKLVRDLAIAHLGEKSFGARGEICSKCREDCGSETWRLRSTQQPVCAPCATAANERWGANTCVPAGSTVRRTDEELAEMRRMALAKSPVRREQLVEALLIAARAVSEFDATDRTVEAPTTVGAA